MKANYAELVKFFFEANNLGKVPRSGWRFLGLRDAEYDAEHCLGTMFIGYVLAGIEGVDAGKVLKMLLVHDLHEVRTGDFDKVAVRYLDPKQAERKALKEMVSRLPKELGREIISLHEEFDGRASKEARIAAQADLLQCAVKAKELIDQGNKEAQNWIDNARKRLKAAKARTALKLLNEIEKQSSSDWWKGLKLVPKKL